MNSHTKVDFCTRSMTCMFCQDHSTEALPLTSIKLFVHSVNTLWSQLSKLIEVRSQRRLIQQSVRVEWVGQEENEHPVTRCIVLDVKEFSSSDPTLFGTVALLCKTVNDEEIIRIIMQKDAIMENDVDWCYGDWVGLRNRVMEFEHYQTRWRGQYTSNGDLLASGAILQVEKCRIGQLVNSNVIEEYEIERCSIQVSTQVEASVTEAAPSLLNSTEKRQLQTPEKGTSEDPKRRAVISALLAPMGYTPRESQSSDRSGGSQSNSSVHEITPEKGNNLGEGLEISNPPTSRMGARLSIPTPTPQPTRLISATRFPGPMILSRMKAFRAEPIDVDDSPRHAVPLCREIQRSKRVREGLPAFECELCREWHSRVEACFPQAASDIVRIGGCQCKSKRRFVVGRHRYAAAPSATPAGFWDVQFPPTQQPD
eukprot:Gregarina_sp_Poly_1__9150@NODE_561_length_7528_cov_34_720949_g441_i0_p3_GENE_NODE_561_length_7528_cov_34_720949_g441_i0NODE_561_length_7528_cov_34_720949_g441_i0_p3_ORF_typecomplete_len426_score29_85SAE2/PF08573_10/1_7e04SAE2/PF08573_10/2_2e02SAE2/PF08573_10/3e05SH3_15/PF18346_1/2_5e03SH3_15/PF18346_1/0_92_NODE_561_length_7528_cov_34_720949_g441_i044225699